jgi:S1-C subfamily serine protease
MRFCVTTILLCCLFLVAVPPRVGAEPAAIAWSESPGTSQSRSWVGVWLGDTIDGGVEVVALAPGGPCHQAGVRVGDILLQANNIELTDQGKLRRVLEQLGPGESLRLIVLRGGKPVESVVKTAERPQSGAPMPRRLAPVPAAEPSPRYRRYAYQVESGLPSELLGLRLALVTPALRRHYGAPDDAGVLVTGVDSGKLAAMAGVEVGDVLIALDERSIVRPEQLESTLLTWNWNRPLRASLVRARGPREVVLVAGVRPPTGAAGSSLESQVAAARSAWQRSQRNLEARKIQLEIDQLQRRIEQLKGRLVQLEREP